MFRLFCPALMAISLMTLSSQQGRAQAFSKFVIFSGSLSDTGNCASINCQPYPSPPYYNNRNTNGPVAVDVVASLLLLSSDASLNLVGPEKGTNYAVYGALASGNRSIDLPAQVSAYLDPRGQIADPDALYFVFIGGNDVIEAIFQPDSVAEATLESAVVGIENAIRRIVAAGGKTILVGNFIDIGTAPGLRAAGFAGVGTARTELFNQLLDRDMSTLERSLGMRILKFDFFGFGRKYLASADKLGFTDTTDSCLASANCDFDRFVFFNDEVPTARIHQLLGNQIVESLIGQLYKSGRGFENNPWSHGQ